mmetsp:Transcript_57633/g.94625  ORF Transcript_57633/g.94625 Transcript_57633/m.94625 type:complete len:224 (-) Transcript_57633:2024-2695(-)
MLFRGDVDWAACANWRSAPVRLPSSWNATCCAVSCNAVASESCAPLSITAVVSSESLRDPNVLDCPELTSKTRRATTGSFIGLAPKVPKVGDLSEALDTSDASGSWKSGASKPAGTASVNGCEDGFGVGKGSYCSTGPYCGIGGGSTVKSRPLMVCSKSCKSNALMASDKPCNPWTNLALPDGGLGLLCSSWLCCSYMNCAAAEVRNTWALWVDVVINDAAGL